MLHVTTHNEQVVIGQLHACCLPILYSIVHSRVVDPSLSGILEVHLLALPLVPLKCAMRTNQKKGEDYQNNNANTSELDEVPTKIVHHGCVHLITKADGILLRHEQRRLIELKSGKRIVDIDFQVFERSIHTRIT